MYQPQVNSMHMCQPQVNVPTTGEQYAYVLTTGEQYEYAPTIGEQYQSYMNSYNYRWTVTITGEQLQPHTNSMQFICWSLPQHSQIFQALGEQCYFP